jgi:hypothetical protein
MRVGGRRLALPALPGEMDRQFQPLPPTRIGSQQYQIAGIQYPRLESSRQKKANIRKSLKWLKKVYPASRSAQECSFLIE